MLPPHFNTFVESDYRFTYFSRNASLFLTDAMQKKMFVWFVFLIEHCSSLQFFFVCLFCAWTC